LALQNSLAMVGVLKILVTMLAQVEAMMSSVERIKYYCEEVDEEEDSGPDAPPRIQPPEDWPQAGAITGTDVHMKYRNGPMVLNGVSFSIKSQEKVGIAGRTGKLRY
jgi:ABC-type multidrug transport system fused ATPase/permease subunit